VFLAGWRTRPGMKMDIWTARTKGDKMKHVIKGQDDEKVMEWSISIDDGEVLVNCNDHHVFLIRVDGSCVLCDGAASAGLAAGRDGYCIKIRKD